MSQPKEGVQPDEAQVARPFNRWKIPDVDNDAAWAGTALADAPSWVRKEVIDTYETSGDIALRIRFENNQRTEGGLQPIPQFTEIEELARKIEEKARQILPQV